MFTYMWALYAREVKRFQKIWLDTIMSPMVSLLLYLAVFGVITGERLVDGHSYLSFVYTGLITMVVVNSSFSNPSFALVISKNLGTIVDLQVAPIKPWGIGIAYALAAFTRGLCIVLIALAATVWFVPGFAVTYPLMVILSIFITGFQFGMFGVVFGMWAKNFEALTFITTFVLQPMIFLAGVFYPISTLPDPWSKISLFNPLHHNVNLFRYGFLGYADTNPWISLGVVVMISMVLFSIMNLFTKRMIRPT